MWRIATDVVWSVCVCVCKCLMVTTVSHAKVAEPIEMPYGRCTLVGRRNHVFHGGLDPPGEEAMSGTSPSSLLSISRIHTHTHKRLSAFGPGQPG